MEIFIGTSGWNYDWNKGKSIEWYRKNTVFNAVELNYSFYRFPTENAVNAWNSFNDISWSVKVNRLITQNLKLNEKSDRYISDFIRVFDKSKFSIDNLLFQLPPSFGLENIGRIIRVGRKFNKYNPVFELRHTSFFNDDAVKTFKKGGITVASTDSPLGKFYVNTSGKVYLRLHGRKNWYSYNYSKRELSDTLDNIMKLKPRKLYVFFNNVYMFKNCNLFINLVKEKYGDILHYKQ